MNNALSHVFRQPAMALLNRYYNKNLSYIWPHHGTLYPLGKEFCSVFLLFFFTSVENCFAIEMKSEGTKNTVLFIVFCTFQVLE